MKLGRLTIVKDKTFVRDIGDGLEEQLQVLADKKQLDFEINVKSDVPDYLMLDSDRVHANID